MWFRALRHIQDVLHARMKRLVGGLVELEDFLQGNGKDRDQDAVDRCRTEYHDRVGHERDRQAQAIEHYADDERERVA